MARSRIEVLLHSMHGYQLRRVTFGQMRLMLDLGQAEIVKLRDGSGRVLGEKLQLTGLDRAAANSPCHITASETHTNGLSKAMKAKERAELSDSAKAYIGRIEDKIKMWPFIGDDRAVRVSPLCHA